MRTEFRETRAAIGDQAARVGIMSGLGVQDVCMVTSEGITSGDKMIA